MCFRFFTNFRVKRRQTVTTTASTTAISTATFPASTSTSRAVSLPSRTERCDKVEVQSHHGIASVGNRQRIYANHGEKRVKSTAPGKASSDIADAPVEVALVADRRPIFTSSQTPVTSHKPTTSPNHSRNLNLNPSLLSSIFSELPSSATMTIVTHNAASASKIAESLRDDRRAASAAPISVPCCVCGEPPTSSELILLCAHGHLIDSTCLDHQLNSIANLQTIRSDGLPCVGNNCDIAFSLDEICSALHPRQVETFVLRLEAQAMPSDCAARMEEVKHLSKSLLNAFTLCCPREGCGGVLDRIEGCNAATCSNDDCKCRFCYLCLQPQDDNAASHAHARQHSGNYWENRPGYTERYHWLLARKQLAFAFQHRVECEVRDQLLRVHEKLLQERKMWPFPAGQMTAKWTQQVLSESIPVVDQIELLQNEAIYQRQQGNLPNRKLVEGALRRLGGLALRSLDIGDMDGVDDDAQSLQARNTQNPHGNHIINRQQHLGPPNAALNFQQPENDRPLPEEAPPVALRIEDILAPIPQLPQPVLHENIVPVPPVIRVPQQAFDNIAPHNNVNHLPPQLPNGEWQNPAANLVALAQQLYREIVGNNNNNNEGDPHQQREEVNLPAEPVPELQQQQQPQPRFNLPVQNPNPLPIPNPNRIPHWNAPEVAGVRVVGIAPPVPAAIIPVAAGDPRVSPGFAALGNMYLISGLIWSGVADQRMNHLDAEQFARRCNARLPSKKEWEGFARALGKDIPGQIYNPELVADTRVNFFWSSTEFSYTGDADGAFGFCGEAGIVGKWPRDCTQLAVRCVINTNPEPVSMDLNGACMIQ